MCVVRVCCKIDVRTLKHRAIEHIVNKEMYAPTQTLHTKWQMKAICADVDGFKRSEGPSILQRLQSSVSYCMAFIVVEVRLLKCIHNHTQTHTHKPPTFSPNVCFVRVLLFSIAKLRFYNGHHKKFDLNRH